MLPDKPKPRWFRFSLRTLFVLVTLVACWLGWQLKWIRDRRDFLANEAALFAARGAVYNLHEDPFAPSAPWPLNWFGEAGSTTIYLLVEGLDHDQLTVQDAAKVSQSRRLFPESKSTMIHSADGNYWIIH